MAGFQRVKEKPCESVPSRALEFFTYKICDLIQEVDKEFNNPCPASVDDVLSRRVWEQLVLDWVQEKGCKKGCNYFYATPGEFFYCEGIENLRLEGDII